MVHTYTAGFCVCARKYLHLIGAICAEPKIFIGLSQQTYIGSTHVRRMNEQFDLGVLAARAKNDEFTIILPLNRAHSDNMG